MSMEAFGDALPSAGETTGGVATMPASGSFSFDALLDVPMPVIIEIGRTSMTLSQILDLQPGSVFELDRLVSDRKLAEGEVVVVGDHFGVRVTRVLADPTTATAR
jgi:flagellar motor switch protein FliN/FliY